MLVFEPQHIQQLARVAGLAAGTVKVVLFGSAARGQTHRWSDLDWMLVIPDERFGVGFLEQSKPAIGAAKAIEEQGLYESHTLTRVAKREGIVLYEASMAKLGRICQN
jgi:predicted nucleotidyltransferase